MTADERWMALALEEARPWLGRTSPNPPVGAVVVRKDRLVGAGAHRRAGTAHAEAIALDAAGRRAKGATLYVTLEPCSHFGRTAPCADAVLASGVARVVVGCRDPHPRVSGKGLRRLRAAGVDVEVGVLAAECRELIAGFAHEVATGRPLVSLKTAISLDGRIATATGESQWITGVASRRRGHELRNRNDAVLVGSGTVLADDPRLDCRIRGGRNPLRVVVDRRLRMPVPSRLLGRDAEKLLVFTNRIRSRKARLLEEAGARVEPAGTDGLRSVLERLAAVGVRTVLLEGGRAIATAALQEGLVGRVHAFVAPRILGADGMPCWGELGIRSLGDAPQLLDVAVERLGNDVLVSGRLPSPPARR